MERGRLDPLQHGHQQGSYSSSWFAPFSPTNSGSTASRPQPTPPSVVHPSSSQFMKDLSNQPPSSHSRKDQGTESKITSSYSGSKNVTSQRKESNKDQSDVRCSIQTIQLHRPPVSTSFYTRGIQEGCSLPPSHSEHWNPENSQPPWWGGQPSPGTQSSDKGSGSSLPIIHIPCQDQQHKRAPSCENLIPVEMNCTSQKRHSELEGCDDSPKKLCLLGINSIGKAQPPKPTVGNLLSTSLLSQPSARHSSLLELAPKTTNGHMCTQPEPQNQSIHLELTSTCKPSQSSCTSLSPKPWIKKHPSLGAKQAYIYSTQNPNVTSIQLRSPSKDPNEESLKKKSNENYKSDQSSSLLSSEVPQKDTSSSPHVQLGSQHSGHTHRSTSVLPVKTLCRDDQVEESGKSDSSTPKSASKTNSGSLGCRMVERNKTARPRRPVAIPNDVDELFTPDPMTYVVSSGHKTANSKTDGIKSPTLEKSSCSIVTSSSAAVTESSCHKTTPHGVDTKVSSFLSPHHPQITMPTLALERVKLEDLKSICSKGRTLQNSPITSSSRQLENKSVKSDEKHTSVLPYNVRPCTLETGTTTSTSHCSPSPLLETSERLGKQVNEEDPVDSEQTQSSQSSEDEQLLSLQEMMKCVTKPPDTPEKGAFSEPSTPGQHSCPLKPEPLPTTTKSGNYKNSLDQMLKEINTNRRAKEIETQLLTECKADLLRIAEYEEAENQEEGISTEQQEFLQRYSLMSSAIKEVPPGEPVFNLEKFGQIFNHNTLQLRRCMVNPQGAAQKTLLWSSPAQLRLHVNIGLFQEAYDCPSPCPTQVTLFLFKMMSVHSERMVSEKILQALCDIACSTAYQIVKNENQQFKVWVPSLADVALVLMNMGVAFITLFPFEHLQPPFTEGDLLEDIYFKSESPSSNKEQSTFPEHNCNNILKYLSYCMGLCPRAYSDDELLLLLTVVGKVALDSRLILQSSVELYPLQYKIVNNIRDWDTMLPRIYLALTNLTDDHHNMCLLVQLLPDNTRGKQLRRHLSLSMISKLLDGKCTYAPTEKEFQLSELRSYLPRMQPSTLLRGMLSSVSRSQKDNEEDMATLDQQAYYLCYSLLTLVNEASNFQFFPAHQKKQLLLLCSELETHIKCDIRESEKCLYRSKVKDLVARIYTKWQILLQRTRPLHGKLYDYWQPLSLYALTSSQGEQEMDNSNDGQKPVVEEDETEDVLMTTEEEEKEEADDTIDNTSETGGDVKPEEMEGDNALADTKETEKETEAVHVESNREMDPQILGQIEAQIRERTEVETENLVQNREISHHNQVEACDLMS